MQSPLGFYINVEPHSGELDKIVRSQVSLVKFTGGNPRDINYLHDRMPNTTFVLRGGSVSGDFIGFGALADPIGAAGRWVGSMRPFLASAPFGYWESFNELPFDLFPQYGIFETERIRLMAQEGYRACIGSFGAGGPDVWSPRDDWQWFLPALAEANIHGSLLGLHEYGGLWADILYDRNQTAFLTSGQHDLFPRQYSTDAWLMCRYRKVKERVLRPNGFNNVRIAITETGLDKVFWEVMEQIAQQVIGGWRTLGPAWLRLNGVTNKAAFFVENMLWYRRQLLYDPDVVGAALFLWGSLGHDWDDFEIEGQVADLLVEDARRFSTYSGVQTISGTGQYVRMSPKYTSRAVAILNPQKIYTLLGAEQGWFRVLLPTGVSGWVDGQYIDFG